MHQKLANLALSRHLGLVLILLGLLLFPYSNSKASQSFLERNIACNCSTPETKPGCDQGLNKCKLPSSKNSCPCPPLCGANMGAGMTSVYLETNKVQPQAPNFDVKNFVLVNTKYKLISYKPPTPPPRKPTQEG
jgi:hypothetical protein